MSTIAIGLWTLYFDPVATAHHYAQMVQGAGGFCNCPGCVNFDEVRKEHFPSAFAELLLLLGADPEKEVSVRRVAPLDAGHSLYAGSYAVVGRILEGPPSDNVEGWRLDVFDQVSPLAHVALRRWENPPNPWEGSECVRLRFLVTLPWKGEDPSASLDLSNCRGPADFR